MYSMRMSSLFAKSPVMRASAVGQKARSGGDCGNRIYGNYVATHILDNGTGFPKFLWSGDKCEPVILE